MGIINDAVHSPDNVGDANTGAGGGGGVDDGLY